jgi:AcrR family transcriptional regulator
MSSSSTEAPADGRRRIRLDADDRREQILAAAQRLFAQRPYSSVSTTELAAEAGTTRTNLHYYFGTKRGLYVEVLRRFGQLPALPRSRGQVATGERELSRLFARWLDVLEQNPQTIMTMLGTSAPGVDPEVEAAFREGLRAWEDRLLAVLDLPDDPKGRARIRTFQGLVKAAVVEWLHREVLTKDDVHQLMVETLVAIGGHPRSAVS